MVPALQLFDCRLSARDRPCFNSPSPPLLVPDLWTLPRRHQYVNTHTHTELHTSSAPLRSLAAEARFCPTGSLTNVWMDGGGSWLRQCSSQANVATCHWWEMATDGLCPPATLLPNCLLHVGPLTVGLRWPSGRSVCTLTLVAVWFILPLHRLPYRAKPWLAFYLHFSQSFFFKK